MNIKLENSQLLVENIPQLIKQLSKYDNITAIDCGLLDNIDSVGIATLIYFKKRYRVQFINLNKALIAMCTLYKITL